MHVRYRFDPATRLLHVVASADADEASFFDYARRIAAAPGLPSGRKELADLRALNATRLSTAALRRLASHFQSADKGEPSRIAIVAGGDLTFGLSRMYQAFRSESVNEIVVFRDLEEACAWLEVPVPQGAPEDEGE